MSTVRETALGSGVRRAAVQVKPMKRWNGKNLKERLHQICLDARLSSAELDLARTALLPFRDGLDHMHEPEMQRAVALALAQSIPRAVDLAQEIRRDALGGRRLSIARGLGFERLEEGVQDLFILAFCGLLGTPCPLSEKIKIVIWPVQPMAGLDPKRKRFNFSVSMTEAEFHTDTSSAPEPEKLFTLWCVRPDPRGGGTSLLVDSRYVVESLKSASHSRRALRILETKELPFFLSEREVTYAPIFAQGREPFLRYRPVLIEKGCAVAGMRLSRPERKALKLLERRLAWKSMALRVLLRKGEVLVCNNHEIFHGREALRDPGRLLKRVRITGDPVYPAAPSPS